MDKPRYGAQAARIARAHGLRAKVLANNTKYAPQTAKAGPVPLGAVIFQTYGNDWVVIYDVDPLSDEEWAALSLDLREHTDLASPCFFGGQ